jgi:YfiH family protein
VKTFAPRWAAPAGIGAAMSLREGAPQGAGPEAVQALRRSFAAVLPAAPAWLRQVHGPHVVRLRPPDASAGVEPVAEADAAWTDEPGLACAVLVADCLPVLFADRRGRAVAAAHAGWRGLAGGVLEATLVALDEGADVAPGDLVAWIGPGISAAHFEVGDDVLAAFGRSALAHDQPHFAWSPRADGTPRWRADLPALARERLHAAGVREVAVDGRCTAADASAFFSFRRDGATGRMAAAVWRRA